jgi:hypothetical protein
MNYKYYNHHRFLYFYALAQWCLYGMETRSDYINNIVFKIKNMFVFCFTSYILSFWNKTGGTLVFDIQTCNKFSPVNLIFLRIHPIYSIIYIIGSKIMFLRSTDLPWAGPRRPAADIEWKIKVTLYYFFFKFIISRNILFEGFFNLNIYFSCGVCGVCVCVWCVCVCVCVWCTVGNESRRVHHTHTHTHARTHARTHAHTHRPIRT